MKKLVCAIGTGEYEETIYWFDGRRKRTNLAPVAIGCCIAGQVKDLELVALLTQKASDIHGERLREETLAQGWAYTPVEIPDGRSGSDLWRIFESFGKHLREGDELMLDLTHGFRHIPALLLSAAQYYSVRKGVELLGIYYGAYDVQDEHNNSPIFDLTPLIDLPEWSYGVRLLSEYQLPGPLGRMLDRIQRRSHQQGGDQRFTRLQKVGRPLCELEAPLATGIPLEAGLKAREALKNASSAEGELDLLPPIKEPWKELRAQLEDLSVSESRKADVALTLEELQRQARLVEGYLSISNLRAAATVMRELVVSIVILYSGDPGRWLDLEERQRAERRLGVLGSRVAKKELSSLEKTPPEKQRELASLWNRLTDRRNALAHAGMRRESVDFGTEKLSNLYAKITDNLANPDFWQTAIERSGNERWLISPLGTTPGALYTALLKTNPTRLLVITSLKGEKLVREILQRAGREDLRPEYAILEDPFNGFGEAKKTILALRNRQALGWVTAAKITVNRTGGTTCLGWAAELLEASLRTDLGLHPRTIACIDRRSPEEQRQQPYVEGEVFNITGEGEER